MSFEFIFPMLTYRSIGPSDNRQEIDGKKAEEGKGEITPERARHQEEDEEGPWYFGRARDEFHRRKNGNQKAPPVPQGEEDPIQVRL
jgi:SEL1 protein